MKRLVLLFALFASGCSVKKYAVAKLGDALAGSGSTYGADEDPELIRQAVPFTLKLIESLLVENPKNEPLLLAACSGFTQYSYAFVQLDADDLEDKDKIAAAAMRVRAARLYLRARNYGLRGLEVRHPNFSERLKANPKEAVKEMKNRDIPLLYWTALSWGAALSALRDFSMLAEIPRFEAMIDRTLELDDAYGEGVIHSFLITYEVARLNAKADKYARAKQHYDRAVELGKGHHAGPFVAYAESVSVPQKNKAEFQQLLQQALHIDLNAEPENRQLNMAAQRHARWLLSHTDKLFPN